MSIILLIIGLVLLIVGANFFVDGASRIASYLHISPLLIGLTIVAFGTSAPEATVSILAAMGGNADVAIGNVVGSNIFNIMFVLGAAATISPLGVDPKIFIDITLMIFLTILLLVFSRTNFKIGKFEGVILAAAYIGYLIYIIMRN